MLPNGPQCAYIDEHGGLTLDRLLGSTLSLTETVAGELLGHWKERRSTAADQMNWATQWPDKVPALIHFKGYAPGSRPMTGDRVVLSPTDGRRVTAAQLDDSVRESV